MKRESPPTRGGEVQQWSGELKGSALDEFTSPTIETGDADIDFAPVPEDPPPAGSPHTTPRPSLRTTPQGVSMFIEQLQGGTCRLRLNLSDLALLALVLRHATENVHLHHLNPLMPSALESLATAFESATLLALQQAGHLQLESNIPLTAEAVQAWCQRVIVEGLPDIAPPVYRAGATASDPERESQQPADREAP
jgi:hypothetical protein